MRAILGTEFVRFFGFNQISRRRKVIVAQNGGPRPNSGRKPWDGQHLTHGMTKYLENHFKKTPLEFLMNVMLDEDEDLGRRIDCAKSALPYCHPRLANVTLTGEVAVKHEGWLNAIERAALGEDVPLIDVTPDRVAA